MVLTATMAEYKLEVAHSGLNIIIATRTIGLLFKPTLRSLLNKWSSTLNPTVFFHDALLTTMIILNLISSRILR